MLCLPAGLPRRGQGVHGGRRLPRAGRGLPQRALLPEVLQRGGGLPEERGVQGRRLQEDLQQLSAVPRGHRLHRQVRKDSNLVKMD